MKTHQKYWAWRTILYSVFGMFFVLSCTQPLLDKHVKLKKAVNSAEIVCTDDGCSGTYVGPEFIDTLDIAHRFSNKMADSVGRKLKQLFLTGKYVKVDLANISMSTKGMGSGFVTYHLNIPFIRVKEKCAAYTSFDHSGGWNHPPDITLRKSQLESVLMPGELLDISTLKTTNEGLQEYWIQWKNKETQAACVKN